jgi:hypothetical protein
VVFVFPAPKAFGVRELLVCRSSNLINAISVEEELGRAQSKRSRIFLGSRSASLQGVEQKVAKKTKAMSEFSDHSFCPSFSLLRYVNRQVLQRILRASWQVRGRRTLRP